MIGRTTLRLVALFAVISIVGIAYVGLRYVGADSLIGLGPYTVKVQMAESGGIFPQAAVSYRGVEIGKVGDMRITPTGLEVELDIEKEAPDVPANAVAVVANRSAVGEQYVDLEPTADSAPYLEDGSVIPVERTRTPVPVDTLLANLNSLATSVPIPELRTTVDELYNSFNRTGPDLQRLLDSSNLLVSDAIRNLPQTTQLLRDGRVVLGTQASLGPQITSFSRDLQLFTAQLKADDPNLRRLVNAAPPAAQQLEGLIRETGPDLSRTLANLLTVTRIVQPRLAGVEQLLVTYPALSAAAPSVLQDAGESGPDGRVHFGLVLQPTPDPPYCQNGYLRPGAGWRPATDLSDIPADTGRFCNEGLPVNPRGAQNSPNPDGSAYNGPPKPPPNAAGAVASPASAAKSGSAQNKQTTAFSSVPNDDVLRNSTRGAPPIIIPGMTQ